MRGLQAMSRQWFRGLGIALLLLVALAIGGFGMLQTPIGRDWLARALAGAASSPGVLVVVEGLDGLLPFQMRATRIVIADERGGWLVLRNITFNLSPAELAVGRVRVRALTAEAADVARWPAASPDTTPPLPLSERLRVPRLPIPVEIDRLSIDRITLDPSIIGDTVEASLAGQATVNGQTFLAALDLHRTDGNPGDLAFRLELSDTPSVLTLRLTANEPTGALLGRVLHRGDRPPLLLSLTGKGPVAAWRGRVEASSGSLARFDADLTLAGLGETSVALSGIAAVDRLVPPEIAPLIGERVPVGLRATVKEGGAIALDNLSIELASGTLTGDAALAGPDRAIAAHLRARLPRLAPATGALGVGLEGSAELIATISGTEDRPRLDLNVEGDNIAAAFSGAEHAEAHLTMTSAGNLGDPAARVEIAAHGQVRGITLPDSTGLSSGVSRDLRWSLAAKAAPSFSTVEVTELSARGVGLDLAGSGIFDQAHGTLDGRVHLSVDDLRPLAGLSSRPIEGTVTLDASIAGLARRQITVTGEFRGGGLDGTLALDAELDNPAELAVRRLQVKAADGAVNGDLHIDLDRGLARGVLHAQLPDLARWSRLAGLPLGGSLDITMGLDVERGQSLDLTLSGDRLASGSGGSRVVIGRLAASARLSDLWGTPSGKARANLTDATFPSGSLASGTLALDGSRPGLFAFTADAKGKVVDPLTLALGGEVDLAPQHGGIDIQIARLTGSLGADRIRLTRPLRLSKRGTDLVLSDLALTFGAGQITGNASRRGQALAMQLAAHNLSLESVARRTGYQDIGGIITLDANVGGTVAAPQGRFTLSGHALRFALPKQPRMPTLGLALDGNWNGREIALNGHASGLKGETIAFTGSVPLILRPAPFAISVPPQGRLALRVQGAGELANLADLLPLGEDRIAGRYALDASLAGAVGAPAVSGSLTIVDGRYENFATGAVLIKMKLNLAGDRDRLTLRDFSAGDTADGSLSARGSLALSGSTPSAELTATLKHFRIAARDEAVVTASGTAAVAGTIASPKLTAQLAAEQGDFAIPDHLPPSVARLNVVEINSRSTNGPAPLSTQTELPEILAALDLELVVPGRVFVRGRGLDSEWGGRVKVTGTSAAPRIAGSLNALRGTFDVLGKSFKITRGRITFDGGAKLDPALDIVAEVASGDVTAQVLIGGLTSNPTITLTSTPALPQDEILARVLFNRSIGQITAAEGIQVAQAAATLAGGGPGVLDRIRSRIGLDRLVFGSAPAGTASSNLNPAAGGNAATGTAVSGGKYVAEGVYVGATQGLTPQSSKVTVEIEVRPHVTVETDLSQTAGTGIGLNYKYDY